MADLSDVLTALKDLLVSAVYPAQQAAGQSSVGFDVLIGIGWPDDGELQAAMDGKRGFISIYPLAGERNVTTWEYVEQDVPRLPPGISVVFDPDTGIAVFDGVANANDVVGCRIGNSSYTVPLMAAWTAAVVCAAILAALPTGSGTVSGNTLTLVYNARLAFVVANNGATLENIGTLERRVQLTVWSYDQASRDKLVSLLTQQVQRNRFLTVKMQADEAVGLRYDTSNWSDKPQNAGAYMRSLVVLVNFQTTVYEQAYAILHPDQLVTVD